MNTTKKRVPRERQLFTGESLHIITDPGVHPREEWLEQVKTVKSRSQIKKAIEQQKILNARNSGRILLERKLREKGLKQDTAKWIKSNPVRNALKLEKLSEKKFLQEIGLQKRPLNQFLKKYKLLNYKNTVSLKGMVNREFWGNIFSTDKNIFMIDDIHNPLIKMSKCCFPIPGDKIFGFIHDDKEIEIHLSECKKFSRSKKNHQTDKIPIDVAWKISKKIKRIHIINIQVVDGTGILFQITKIIKEAGVAIINSETSIKKNKEANIRIKLDYMNWPVFHKIVEKLRPLKFVKKIWEESNQKI